MFGKRWNKRACYLEGHQNAPHLNWKWGDTDELEGSRLVLLFVSEVSFLGVGFAACWYFFFFEGGGDQGQQCNHRTHRGVREDES